MRAGGQRCTRGLLALYAALTGTLLVGCAGTPPREPTNLCAIFRERPDWYEASRDSYRKWGVSVPLQMAVIQRESSFQSDARPPRTWFLGFIPGPRASTAYGYGQVLDGTWDGYQRATGNRGADRNDFSDVTDFIGWYGSVGQAGHGISARSPEAFYASYHVGHVGYKRGRHHNNATAQRAIRDVHRRSGLYADQYNRCREELDDLVDSSWWWPF